MTSMPEDLHSSAGAAGAGDAAAAARGVALGWALFAAAHIGLQIRAVRARLVASPLLGPGGFVGVYGVLSLASMLYLHKAFLLTAPSRAPVRLWDTPQPRVLGFDALKIASSALKWAGLLVLLQGAMQPQSPVAVGGPEGHAQRAVGLLRVTRHPTNALAFPLLGLGALMGSSYLTDVLYYGGWVVVPLLGSFHQDARLRHRFDAEFLQKTSVFPFAAIAAGRNCLWATLREIRPRAVVASALVGLFFHFDLHLKTWTSLRRRFSP